MTSSVPPARVRGRSFPRERPRIPELPQVRVGTDVVAVERVAELLATQPALAAQMFTERELAYCSGRRRSGEHLAARFAAKEAVLKALGTGLGARMRWTDVEIINRVSGCPQVRLHGHVAAMARRKRLQHIEISLSHATGLAIAYVALVCRGEGPARFRPAGACGGLGRALTTT